MRQGAVTNCVDRRLLQNAATLVTKCVASIYYKMLQPLLQNAQLLLQNAQVITKCVVITKSRRTAGKTDKQGCPEYGRGKKTQR